MKEFLWTLLEYTAMGLAPILAGVLIWCVSMLAKKIGLDANSAAVRLAEDAARNAVDAAEQWAINELKAKGARPANGAILQKATEVALSMTAQKIGMVSVIECIEAEVRRRH